MNSPTILPWIVGVFSCAEKSEKEACIPLTVMRGYLKATRHPLLFRGESMGAPKKQTLAPPAPIPTLKLYELSAAHRNIMHSIVENGGEISDETLEQLEAVEKGIERKTNAICRMRAEHARTADAIDAEIKRLQTLKKSHANAADSLKGYLHRCMDEAGTDRIETDLFKVWIQNSPPSCECTVDPARLPENLQRIDICLDVEAARNLWKAGEPLPEGVRFIQGRHIVIR